MGRGIFKVRLLIAFTFSLVGCGSSGRGAPTTGQDAAPDVAAPTGKTWSGSVYEGLIGPDGGTVPIGDAMVCVVDHPEIGCARTAPDGRYTMMLPPVDAPVRWAVNMTAQGHLGSTTAADYFSWPSGVGLKPDDWARTMATQAGFAYPSNGSAFIRLRVASNSQGVAGATAALSSVSGVGPIYGDEAGDPNPAPAVAGSRATGARKLTEDFLSAFPTHMYGRLHR